MKMLLRTVLINTLHPALEYAEKTFNGISVYFSTPILTLVVPDKVMRSKVSV